MKERIKNYEEGLERTAEQILDQLITSYTSAKRDLIMRLRKKQLTENEFMTDVDRMLASIPAAEDTRQEARTMFSQYLFGYYRLTPLIDDPDISDIHCIAYDRINVKKRGKRMAAGEEISFASEQEYSDFIDRVATKNGVNISNLNAIQRFTDDTSHPDYILRFTLVMPIVTTYGGHYLILRKVPRNFPEIPELVEKSFLSRSLAEDLVHRFRSGSTLICGGNSAGKSTLLNALKETLPEDMAVIVAQQADELTTKGHPDMIFLHSLAESAESAVDYDLEQISIAALTMDVDFFIVGEVKGAEAMYLLNAAYTGQKSAATVHAQSAYTAPDKIVDYALQAHGNKYSKEELMIMIASCFNTVIHVNRYHIDQALEITGWDPEEKKIRFVTIYDELQKEVKA